MNREGEISKCNDVQLPSHMKEDQLPSARQFTVPCAPLEVYPARHVTLAVSLNSVRSVGLKGAAFVTTGTWQFTAEKV